MLVRSLMVASLLSVGAMPLSAQIIQIKTLPIADGDQWRFFPSANLSLGGVGIALRDSLGDPFDQPAKGARLSDRGRGLFFGSPTFYSVSKNAGGGATLPLGGIMRSGATFGGIVVAVQEIDPARASQSFPVPVGVSLVAPNGSTLPATGTPSRQNRYAFATLGHLFSRAGVSVGASALWSGLRDVDGTDLLYTGSQSIDQHGGSLDLRLGMLKDWSGGRAFEAMVLHDRFAMTHDVTWADQVWDPNTRTTVFRARVDNNQDRTNTWGLHLGYSQPLADSGWRVGTIVTTNLMTHPKLPDYQIAQAMVIPWDPGHSAAYDVGIGIAKTSGLATFGVDAIYEPIRTHTWGETPDSVVTQFGVLPAGSKTTENHFKFSNAILRAGAGREIPLDTLHSAFKSVHLEAGLALRSIDYTLDQLDHLTNVPRTDQQSWIEWTRTWGFGVRFSDLEFRYTGRTTTGTGRPGISANGGGDVFLAASSVAGGTNFLAPSTGATLTGVAVTTHQFAVSVPIR